MKVAVCVITFRRPEGVQRLLRGLDALTFEDTPPEIEIIVVDNDANGSGEQACNEVRPDLRWPVTYRVEPRRGIPYARNAAVACALESADLIAFIDDDEVPDPAWLDELLSVQRSHDADVATGPVVCDLPTDVPRWIVQGRFFESPRYETGTRRDVAYTHNVLVKSKVYRSMDTIFDQRMTMTGGTDSHFFRRVHRAGYSIVWANEALVRETIPESRACFRWLVQRAFRAGNGMTIIQRDTRPSWTTGVVLASKSVVWMMIGIVVSLPGLLLGRHVLVKGIRFAAYGVGMLAGLGGTRYEEYRKTHGV